MKRRITSARVYFPGTTTAHIHHQGEELTRCYGLKLRTEGKVVRGVKTTRGVTASSLRRLAKVIPCEWTVLPLAVGWVAYDQSRRVK